MTPSLQDLFERFLLSISIGPPQTDRMESAAREIMCLLNDRYSLSPGEIFLQGSYPNLTAVEPIEGGEYDIDIIAICASPTQTADQALVDLEATFRDDGRYQSRVRPKKPCVRLEYAPDDVGKFHVDVVPTRRSNAAETQLEVPRRGDGWHSSAPKQYTDWCLAQGDAYQRTVKIAKRWRDHQQSVRSAIKSIVLQVLIAEHMPRFAVSDAQRFGQTIVNLHRDLRSIATPPRVSNPVLPDEDLASRWTIESFRNFKTELAEAHELVTVAFATDDVVESAEWWRDLLGEDFPPPDATELGLTLGDTSHEQSFQARGWKTALNPDYAVSLDVGVQRGLRGKIRPYDSEPIFAGNKIRFAARTLSPFRSDVWWQVTNTGTHAGSVSKGLRGQFLRALAPSGAASKDPRVHWESTAYTGAHRVRALLIRQDTVVAVSDYVQVNIWSKNWRTV